MTITEVIARVEEIRGAEGDPETAHWMEDQLITDVLRAIEEGAANPAELARAALLTTTLDHQRWYA